MQAGGDGSTSSTSTSNEQYDSGIEEFVFVPGDVTDLFQPYCLVAFASARGRRLGCKGPIWGGTSAASPPSEREASGAECRTVIW